MTVEEDLARLQRQLQEDYGVFGASYVMDRPPGGWSRLVTIELMDARFEAMDAKLDALRHEFHHDLADLRSELRGELREQTWRLAGLILVAFGIFTTLVKVV